MVLPVIPAIVVLLRMPGPRTYMPIARWLASATGTEVPLGSVLVPRAVREATVPVAASPANCAWSGALKFSAVGAVEAVSATAAPVAALIRFTAPPVMEPTTVFTGMPLPATVMPTARPAVDGTVTTPPAETLLATTAEPTGPSEKNWLATPVDSAFCDRVIAKFVEPAIGATLWTVVPNAMPGPVICWPTKIGVAGVRTTAAVWPAVVEATTDWPVAAVAGVVMVTPLTAPAVIGAESVIELFAPMETIVAPAGTLVPVTAAPIIKLLVGVVSVTTFEPTAPVAGVLVGVIWLVAPIGLKMRVAVVVGAPAGVALRVTTPVRRIVRERPSACRTSCWCRCRRPGSRCCRGRPGCRAAR